MSQILTSVKGREQHLLPFVKNRPSSWIDLPGEPKTIERKFLSKAGTVLIFCTFLSRKSTGESEVDNPY